MQDSKKTEESLNFHLDRIKEIQKDLSIKEGNLTCRVLLRSLNCNYENEKVTLSVKELFRWFEMGQHLKQWNEIDTI